MFFEATRIIKEMRDATGNLYPRVAVWENVPGALTSNKGADFQIVLNEMVDCGSHITEWAVLDAQHFGVPQRRRRIFLVAIFDPTIANGCPNPLFPLIKGRRGDYEKGIKKGQTVAGTSTESARSSIGTAVKAKRAMSNIDNDRWEEADLCPTLNAFDNGGESRATVLAFTAQRVGETPRIYEDSTPALLSRMVRRLTPLECERLMGWPDDHTRWNADGKEQSDSARYKQCGNGVATPVARWVAQQLEPLL
jgi:DNA (cytosine-5)-methyltransferase 1